MPNKSDFYDEIYAQLDALMKDSDESVDDLQNKVNSRYENGPVLSDLQANQKNSRIVKRPSLADDSLFPFISRFDSFNKLIENVDYGTYNATEYVSGHSAALKKYYAQAKSSSQDLLILEGRVNDEITKYNHIAKNNLYIKGYYDGLLYVYRALKRSKELAIKKIEEVLKRGIN